MGVSFGEVVGVELESNDGPGVNKALAGAAGEVVGVELESNDGSGVVSALAGAPVGLSVS